MTENKSGVKYRFAIFYILFFNLQSKNNLGIITGI